MKIISAEKMSKIPVLKVCRENPHITLPAKSHPTDSGYDISVIGVHKVVSEFVTLYKTGLFMDSPPGYYLDLIARSSLMKTGYMLANCVGVIDNSYRGEVLVALYKFDHSFPDLILPARVAQLVPRKVIHFEIVDVANLDESVRGDGGFGSTG